MGLRAGRIGVETVDAAANQGRQVRHDPDDGMVAQFALDRGDGKTGRNGNQAAAILQEGRVGRHDLGDLLRLHGDDDGIEPAAVQRFGGSRMLGTVRDGRGSPVHRCEARRNLIQPATQHGAAHFPASDHQNFHRASLGLLFPHTMRSTHRMSVPSRVGGGYSRMYFEFK